jgi:hypothetical protein
MIQLAYLPACAGRRPPREVARIHAIDRQECAPKTGRLPRRRAASALILIMALVTSGCAAQRTIVESAGTRAVGLTHAFVTLGPGGPAILSVIESDYANATRQTIALATHAPQNDLFSHATEGLPEIGEIRDRIAQVFQEGRIELMALKHGESVRVEADRAIDLSQTIAHSANDVDEQRRTSVRDFDQRAAFDAQSGDGSARSGGRCARQLRQCARFADETRRLQRRNGDDTTRAVSSDGYLSRQDQQSIVARLSLDHQDRAGIESFEPSDFDQKRDIGVGEIAESAGHSNGGA